MWKMILQGSFFSYSVEQWDSFHTAAFSGGGNKERKAGAPSCSISGVIREEMASVPLQNIHCGRITLVMR